MIDLLSMAALFALTGELRLEEARIATIPDGIELEGAPLVGPDGKEWPNVHRVQWSPDGRRVAYVGLKEGRTHAVIGEDVLESYHFLSAPVFSDDGEHVAFRAGNRKSAKQEQWWVLLDGKQTGAEDWIGAVQFRPGTDELCYWTQPGARIGSMGEYTGGDLVLRAGKRKSKKWDDANALMPLHFSADGEVIASPAMRGGKWTALVFDKKGERKPGKQEGLSMLSAVALSPNGKEVALCGADPRGTGSEVPDLPPGMAPPRGMFGMKLIVMHGKEVYGRDELGAGQAVFSPNGKSLAYKLLSNEGMAIAVDGKTALAFQDGFVQTPVWSPDSKRIAYGVNEGGAVDPFWRLSPEGDGAITGGKVRVVQHDPRGKHEERGEEFLEVRDLVWNSDSSKLAYCARTAEGWIVVCGAMHSSVFDEVGTPSFAPDDGKLLFGARVGRELWWKVLELE
ncbi:MAG: PD40 domain-containing protein [Planctomycetes bacterium]|nr:PD40 domain-containing protein [Planctomycetota bacterium]MCB9903059.1 PD40 domain-containing protein [Planctomycetota bacterium]